MQVVKSEIKDTLLNLVRVGIGHPANALPSQVDWPVLQTLAARQGLTAVVLDGLDKLPQTAYSMPNDLKRQWIGDVLQGYEFRYERYRKTIGEMAAFYNAHGFRIMVLKGYACSLDWPKPEHRPCGDIDIWQFGQQKEADAALTAWFKGLRVQGVQGGQGVQGFKIDDSHQHHTVFAWNGFTVENHYDFVNVIAHTSSRRLERVFKQLGEDDSHFVEVDGEKIYLPSSNLHALFLLRHMVSHFASTQLNLRQILDWGFFVKAHTHEINWEWLLDKLDEYHMMDFFACLNAICGEDMGFLPTIFPSVPSDAALKERILNDTLSPEFGEVEPKGLAGRVAFKYRRWQANAWKQRLCYGESRWNAFWSGVWNHVLKPSSI